MGKIYRHIAIDSKRTEEIEGIKKKLNEIKINHVTNDEVMEILFEKDRRCTLSVDDIRKLIGKYRGVGI